jgi:hypothetical protein
MLATPYTDKLTQVAQDLADEREEELERLEFNLSEALRNLSYAELNKDMRIWSHDELDEYYAALASVEIAQDEINEFHNAQR